MDKIDNRTKEKIILSALTLFSKKGIGKTCVNEIAYQAGVTRVTVYRYFPEKRELIRATMLRFEQVFEKGLEDLKQNPQADWVTILDQIGKDLNALPQGDTFARFDELKRLYPDVYESIQEVRMTVLNGIFDHFFAQAERQGLLRPGLNRSLVHAFFWELAINFFDNPRFKSVGLSDETTYRVITDLFLHGVFISQSTEN